MNQIMYERACEVLQEKKFKLTFAKLCKLISTEFEEIDVESIDMAINWGRSLYRIKLPGNANAYIPFGTHVLPLYIDNEHGSIYRINKNGKIKEVPLDLTKKYGIRYLYENIDTSFEYFNVNTYTINNKDIRNWLPIRCKKIGTFKTPIKNELVEQNRDQVEFWYNDSWLNLLEHLFIYKNYSFKDLCN